MEILLLLALAAGAWVLWKRSRGEDPTASAFGKLAAGCFGLGCIGVIVVFLIGVVLAWLLLQALADVDLSLSELGDEPRRDGPDDGTSLH